MDKNSMTNKSTFFVGRNELIDEIVVVAKKHGAVLLFGGRQSGKTTLLRRLTEVLSTKMGDTKILSSLDIPVYVDLMRLPVEATPDDFFDFLISSAATQCKRQINGFTFTCPTSAERSSDSLTNFVFDLERLNQACAEVNIKIIFLLDEAKRVLNERFTRGFQDNIFALLYGDSELRPVPLSFVFAGAQHLYKLSEDSTSPIGSRAAPIIIRNLTTDNILEYCIHYLGANESSAQLYADFVYKETGGHAGLMNRIVEEISGTTDTPFNAEEISKIVQSRNIGLLDNWISSLTTEAICVAGSLSHVQSLSLGDVAQHLVSAGLNRFLATRVIEEICYTGIAIFDQKRVFPANQLFWSYFNSSSVVNSGEGEAQETWHLIEATELLLREVILDTYISVFDSSALPNMRKILGDKTWDKILEIQNKSSKQYRFSKQQDNRDIMSCMYIGDLQTLIIHNLAWASFKSRFRDKRELEDIIKAIAPVRNDRAHFSIVPEKELKRCRIACDDLMVLFERSESQNTLK